jgi:hypothetical protein
MQSVPITTNVEFEALSWRDVFDTTLCDKVRHCQDVNLILEVILQFQVEMKHPCFPYVSGHTGEITSHNGFSLQELISLVTVSVFKACIT